MLRKGKSRLQKLRHYFRRNPGSLFIVAFQILIVSAGALLASGNPIVANEVANYAFYSVVIGVAIYIIQLFRERKRHTRTDSSGPSEDS